jgi:membrane carboxypeptidase/penicillin-binding protein PbpC
MIKWLVRLGLGLAALAILLAAGAAGYLWYQGSQAMSRAQAAGWFRPAPADAPLSVFETTVAKAEFGETWNQTGIPCRTFARLTGVFARSGPTGMSISQMLARDIQFADKPEQSIASQFNRLALSCQLERAYSDTELLRIWLTRLPFAKGVVGVDAAANAYFHKPPAELNDAESARLAALTHDPPASASEERWSHRTKYVEERVHDFDWDGKTMTRIGGAQ